MHRSDRRAAAGSERRHSPPVQTDEDLVADIGEKPVDAWHQKLPGTAHGAKPWPSFLTPSRGVPLLVDKSRLGEEGQVLEPSPVPLLL